MNGTIDLKQAYEKITSSFKKDKKTSLIFIAGILGMLLILLSTYFDKPAKKENNLNSSANAEYVSQLEAKLKTLISNIEGVGEANVMVTIENGIEYVYAYEEKKNVDCLTDYNGVDRKKVQEKNDTEQKYIFVDSPDGKKQALLLTEQSPQIKGVVVVCEGADNPIVEQRVLNAVKISLNIPSSRICIAKSK